MHETRDGIQVVYCLFTYFNLFFFWLFEGGSLKMNWNVTTKI